MVPGLFTNEMKRRRDYYIKHPCPATHQPCGSVDSEANGLLQAGESSRAHERIIYSEDEKISLSLEFSSNGCPPDCCHHQEESDRLKLNLLRVAGKYRVKKKKISSLVSDCRYLLCPASVTVAHLKKFIRMKFSLSPRYKIDIFHTDESLSDDYTLIDIAYIYTWRRRGPLRLFYSVYENPAKRIKFSEPSELEVSSPTSTSTDTHSVAASIPHPAQNGDKSDCEPVKESARSGGGGGSGGSGSGGGNNYSSNNSGGSGSAVLPSTNAASPNSNIASVNINTLPTTTTTTASSSPMATISGGTSRPATLSTNIITTSSVPPSTVTPTTAILTSTCSKATTTTTTTLSNLEVKGAQLTAAAMADNQNLTFKTPEDEKFEKPKDFKELVFNGQVMNGHDDNVIVKTEPMTDALSVTS